MKKSTYILGAGLMFIMLLGNVLGVGLAMFQQNTHFFKLDQASYYMKYVPIQADAADILLLNAGTLVICLIVLLIPSMLVTRISPLKAITFK